MLQLNFNSIHEAELGEKWKTLFNTHWPAYKAWFVSKGAVSKPDLKTSQSMLRQYMPEFMPTYERLCSLAGNDPVAERFLTGYQPPAYISGCSQAVWQKTPQLVRNYDYHPHLSEGTILNSAWNGKHVMAIGDCLWGVVDGMNSDGLVASLTFGGRKIVGEGFGIPFILRYVLEFCSDIKQAVEVLERIPSHMAYNIMLLDKAGNHKMLQLAPDHKPIVTDARVSTNHQGAIDWPEHARFSKTLEREKFLIETLDEPNQTAAGIAKTFLNSPLFKRQYTEGFGTVYTSVYRPAEGYMELHWQDNKLKQSFADFQEGNTLISYSEKAVTEAPVYTETVSTKKSYEVDTVKDADYWVNYGKAWSMGDHFDLTVYLTKTIGDALGLTGTDAMEKMTDQMTAETKRRGQVPWELLADLWYKL